MFVKIKFNLLLKKCYCYCILFSIIAIGVAYMYYDQHGPAWDIFVHVCVVSNVELLTLYIGKFKNKIKIYIVQ